MCVRVRASVQTNVCTWTMMPHIRIMKLMGLFERNFPFNLQDENLLPHEKMFVEQGPVTLPDRKSCDRYIATKNALTHLLSCYLAGSDKIALTLNQSYFTCWKAICGLIQRIVRQPLLLIQQHQLCPVTHSTQSLEWKLPNISIVKQVLFRDSRRIT